MKGARSQDAAAQDVPIRPSVRHAKKSEVVARTIAHELFTEGFTSGALIDVEDDLVKRLGVSRGTLREGLRLLEVLGVVESRIGRSGGIAVRRPSAEHFAQIITFYLQFSGCTYRQLLEVHVEVYPLIAGIAAAGASASDLTRLQAFMADFELMPIDQQIRAVPTVTSIYNDMITNPLWSLLAGSIHAVISGHLEELLVPESEWPKTVRTVRRVAAAVSARDATKAEHLIRLQLQAWLEIASAHQRELLDSPIMWATGDDLFTAPGPKRDST